MTTKIPRFFLLQKQASTHYTIKRYIYVFLIVFICLDILEPSQRRFIDSEMTRANLGLRQKSRTLRLKSPARSLRFWCRRRVTVRRSRISRSYVMLAVLQMYKLTRRSWNLNISLKPSPGMDFYPSVVIFYKVLHTIFLDYAQR